MSLLTLLSSAGSAVKTFIADVGEFILSAGAILGRKGKRLAATPATVEVIGSPISVRYFNLSAISGGYSVSPTTVTLIAPQRESQFIVDPNVIPGGRIGTGPSGGGYGSRSLQDVFNKNKKKRNKQYAKSIKNDDEEIMAIITSFLQVMKEEDKEIKTH